VVQPAVADIVGPAVASDDPNRLLDKVIGKGPELPAFLVVALGDDLLEPGNPLALRVDFLLANLVGVNNVLDKLWMLL
jgi:hypothetical protein